MLKPFCILSIIENRLLLNFANENFIDLNASVELGVKSPLNFEKYHFEIFYLIGSFDVGIFAYVYSRIIS